MLAYQWHNQTGTPVVFLHGLLGSKDDWAKCFAHLHIIPNIRPLALDLPFHGNNQHQCCNHFNEIRQWLDDTLKTLINEPFWLVGYSLGGRIALDYTFNCPNPDLQGTILEGANIGLKSESERLARWDNDHQWAERFRTEPIQQVLRDWYHQPVFSQLSQDKRLDLIQIRQKNSGKQIAQMLEATSLAKQDYFKISDEKRNIIFLIGEQDHKFRQIAEEHQLPHRLIAKAGHNTHWENPKAFMQQLKIIIEGQ